MARRRRWPDARGAASVVGLVILALLAVILATLAAVYIFDTVGVTMERICESWILEYLGAGC